MTNHGDDCYFFYYSTCSKGDSCPFRHCEAAMGNEIVCSLWLEGRCFRSTCKFRHMEITKNRKEIPCYWENQAAGCQKPHCAFFHDKPRHIDGLYFPADKSSSPNEDQLNEEPSPPPAAPLPTAANPQLRSIIKTESLEPVPSPTHPPVVINPADDDEDEDDQFSEEGDDGKVGFSPRKLPKLDNSLNFGVSTLEEIRLRKALKASMKRAGYPLQNADASANRETESIHSFFRPAMNETRDGPLVFDGTVRRRGSMAERLGRKMLGAGDAYGEGVPPKRSLVERLGRVLDVEPPQKALKPVKERLGLSAESGATHSVETKMESNKAPEEIRIKTLEEIRQEKAAKSQSLSKESPSVVVPDINNAKRVKRAITIKEHPINHVKTFSEVLHAKKKRPMEENREKHTAEKAPSKSQGESDTAGPRPEAASIHIKTLEEIRREKAARIQAQQASETESKKSSDAEESIAKIPRLLRINKRAAQTEKIDDVTEKPVEPQKAPPKTSVANGNIVKVKTFEEIMREKRLRKQEMEEKARGLAEAEPCQKEPAEGTLKKVLPPPGSSSPSSITLDPDTTVSTPKVPVRKLTLIKSTAASPPTSGTTPGTTPGTTDAAAAAPVTPQSVSPPESSSQSPTSTREVPKKHARKSGSRPSPAKQTRAASQSPAAEAPTADRTQSNSQKKTPDNSTNTKVRPKLNVKPSVVKPAVQVKPGQKRRGGARSAVAAVKPLNSASAGPEEPLQEAACRDKQVFPSCGAEAQLSSAVPHSPTTLLDSSPLSEELQTVPVFKQSLGPESKPTVGVAAASETCPVAQSPVLKTPKQPKSRRTSAPRSRTSSTTAASAAASNTAVDAFEELINEFTDEHLQDEDVDPEMGEDDLLQELSEMIDS